MPLWALSRRSTTTARPAQASGSRMPIYWACRYASPSARGRWRLAARSYGCGASARHASLRWMPCAQWPMRCLPARNRGTGSQAYIPFALEAAHVLW